MVSERLTYRAVTPTDLDALVSLVQNGYVRRYMMDGVLHRPAWCAERIRESEALFEQRGVGLWLAYELGSGELVGFCGFLEVLAVDPVHPEPELAYALLEQFSGRGYATEMARASIAFARSQSWPAPIFAGVDEVNAASLRVLEKLGFTRVATHQGAFGNMFLLRLG
jgi:[ribosomal protein S5]-alanine N-acetyltransferase